MSFFVYVLISESTGETYTGQTGDLERRFSEHNDPNYYGTLHTKRRKGPWKLLHCEEFDTRAEAIRRERWFKTGSAYRFIKKLKNSVC
jgi:putative endonuclease